MVHWFISLTARTAMPQIATIAVTDRCDSACEGCYFNNQLDSNKNVLTPEELKRVMADLAAMGVFTIAFVGGEPLLHPDIVDIVAAHPADRSSLLLFTNASRLEPLAADLKKAGLNRVYASLEYADAGRHDAYCRHRGLFDKALAGIAAANRAGMLTGFSWTLHADAQPHDLQEVIRLCRETRVRELYICREIKPGYEYACSPFTAEDAFFQEIRRANADKKNRFGIVYYHYMMSALGFGGCPAGGTRLYISPYGDVTPCDVIMKSFGNVRQQGLPAVWAAMTRHPGLGTISGPCRIGLEL
jgi:MoaA/NifB/PqqE/SkfB family radical SAM enzyme